MISSLNVFSAVLGYPIEDIRRIEEWLQAESTVSRCYYSYNKRKSNGKFRVIAPSYSEMKDIQNRLQSRIFRHVTFPYFITGSIKRRSGVINGKLHSGKKYHLQTDIVGFFDFVQHRAVYSALLGLGFSADVASLITRFTTYKGHLPQGAPTSPFLANLVGLTIDNLLLPYCEVNGISYSRYVDDITFSSHQDFKVDVETLLSSIVSAGFMYSYKKTVYKAGDIQVTGASTGCLGITGTHSQIQNLKSISTSEASRKGIEGHLRYIRSIHKNFRIREFKALYPSMTFPTKIFPYMNRRGYVNDVRASA